MAEKSLLQMQLTALYTGVTLPCFAPGEDPRCPCDSTHACHNTHYYTLAIPSYGQLQNEQDLNQIQIQKSARQFKTPVRTQVHH
jgi:hypothetical protein